MTEPKREPFAEVAVLFEGQDPGKRLLVNDVPLFEAGKEYEVEDVATIINAAFNARVDAEIKKAVEEFRERAAKLAENCLSKDGEAIGFAIRCLPTEPERGKE